MVIKVPVQKQPVCPCCLLPCKTQSPQALPLEHWGLRAACSDGSTKLSSPVGCPIALERPGENVGLRAMGGEKS